MTDCACRLAAERVGMKLAEYPVRHHAPRFKGTLTEIRDWCWDEYVDCIRVGTFWFFRSESDRVLFVMRWGG